VYSPLKVALVTGATGAFFFVVSAASDDDDVDDDDDGAAGVTITVASAAAGAVSAILSGAEASEVRGAARVCGGLNRGGK
jgi:hypothetical protein